MHRQDAAVAVRQPGAARAGPKDFLVTVREIQLAAGAGFVVPITGEILRMPGLPKEPLAERFDLWEDGEVLFNR